MHKHACFLCFPVCITNVVLNILVSINCQIYNNTENILKGKVTFKSMNRSQ